MATRVTVVEDYTLYTPWGPFPDAVEHPLCFVDSQTGALKGWYATWEDVFRDLGPRGLIGTTRAMKTADYNTRRMNEIRGIQFSVAD